MQEFVDTARNLDPELLRRFRLALETGRWPDGRALTDSQRETVMQALIVYEQSNLDASERTAALDEACPSRAAESSPLNTDGLS